MTSAGGFIYSYISRRKKKEEWFLLKDVLTSIAIVALSIIFSIFFPSSVQALVHRTFPNSMSVIHPQFYSWLPCVFLTSLHLVL